MFVVPIAGLGLINVQFPMQKVQITFALLLQPLIIVMFSHDLARQMRDHTKLLYKRKLAVEQGLPDAKSMLSSRMQDFLCSICTSHDAPN